MLRQGAACRCLPAVRLPCSRRRPAGGGTRKEDRDMSGGYPMEGGCGCRDLRYRLTTAPLIVHCCHCRWCQRETGSAFVLNAVVEDDRLELLHGSRSEEHTSELQSLMRSSYAVFCLKKTKKTSANNHNM